MLDLPRLDRLSDRQWRDGSEPAVQDEKGAEYVDLLKRKCEGIAAREAASDAAAGPRRLAAVVVIARPPHPRRRRRS